MTEEAVKPWRDLRRLVLVASGDWPGDFAWYCGVETLCALSANDETNRNQWKLKQAAKYVKREYDIDRQRL